MVSRGEWDAIVDQFSNGKLSHDDLVRTIMFHTKESELISEEGLIQELERRVDKAGGQKKLGDALSVTPNYISLILNGHTRPGPCIFDALGYELVRMYRKKPKGRV